MAKEAAAAFVKRYGNDEAFRTKVNGLDSPQAIRGLLDQEGFGQFTREELEDARKAANAGGELSDVELEAVAGGSWARWESSCAQVDVLNVYCSGVACTSVW